MHKLKPLFKIYRIFIEVINYPKPFLCLCFKSTAFSKLLAYKKYLKV